MTTKTIQEMPDLSLPGVKVFQLEEGESAPGNPFQDLSVKTVIIYRTTPTGESTTIARRREEEPKLRQYMSPKTFETNIVETTMWDVTHTYKDYQVMKYELMVPTHVEDL